MKELSATEVRTALAAVVADAGTDYVYPLASEDGIAECQYRDEYGGCIVGQTFDRLLGLDWYKPEFEGKGVQGLAEHLEEDLEVVLDEDTLQALVWAQDYQDHAGSWGGALERFDSALNGDAHWGLGGT